MPDQPLDRLNPGDVVAEVKKTGHREPNCPGTADKKMTRLRSLVWSGAWSDQDIGLIAWSEAKGCWVMWRSE